MTTNEKVMNYLKNKYPLNKNTSDKPTVLVVLDGQNIKHITDDIKKYLENFKELEELTLSICNLTSLKNLPDLPKLLKIELNDNHFKGDELINLCKYKNLSELRIANNDINKFDDIKCLEQLSELTVLDFTDSPITRLKDYRDIIFEKFKKLKFLDGIDKNGNVLDEDDEDEDDELDEEDKGFIDDDKKEGDENGLEEEDGDDDDGEDKENDNDDEDDEKDEKEEKEEKEEENDDEIKNPNPAKKRKLE